MFRRQGGSEKRPLVGIWRAGGGDSPLSIPLKPPDPRPEAMASITGETFPDVLKGNKKYKKVITEPVSEGMLSMRFRQHVCVMLSSK